MKGLRFFSAFIISACLLLTLVSCGKQASDKVGSTASESENTDPSGEMTETKKEPEAIYFSPDECPYESFPSPMFINGYDDPDIIRLERSGNYAYYYMIDSKDPDAVRDYCKQYLARIVSEGYHLRENEFKNNYFINNENGETVAIIETGFSPNSGGILNVTFLGV